MYNLDKVKSSNSKIFINEYGVFYEGQILNYYITENKWEEFKENVILEKFIFHKYKDSENRYLKVRIFFYERGHSYNYSRFTFSSDTLGTLFKL